MEREKEIEQMIRDYYHFDEYIPSDDLQEAIRKGGYINIVNLYNANYRKISEGSEVLTKEELRAIQNREAFQEMRIKRMEADALERKICELEEIKNTKHRLLKDGELDETKDHVRKETAREILHTLWGWLNRKSLFKDDIIELAEKYGVEVEE